VPAWGSQWLPPCFYIHFQSNAQKTAPLLPIKLITHSGADPPAFTSRMINCYKALMIQSQEALFWVISFLISFCLQKMSDFIIFVSEDFDIQKTHIGLAAHSWAFWADQHLPACHMWVASCCCLHLVPDFIFIICLCQLGWQSAMATISLVFVPLPWDKDCDTWIQCDRLWTQTCIDYETDLLSHQNLLWWLGLVSGFNMAQVCQAIKNSPDLTSEPLQPTFTWCLEIRCPCSQMTHERCMDSSWST